MRNIVENIKGLVLKCEKRPAGSMEKDGETIAWEDADQIVVLPLSDTRGNIKKYRLLPEKKDVIYKKMELVNWGALVSLSFTGNYVSDVEIVADWADAVFNQMEL